VRQQRHPPRIRRVDRHDVQIARESQMLKAVVQNKTLGTEVFIAPVLPRFDRRC
jgi:hypothetical protein